MKSYHSKKSGRTSGTKTLTGHIKSKAPRGVLSSSLRGLAVALLIGLILLLIASVAIYSTADPNRYVSPASLSVLLISALFGGFFATRINRGSALLCGVLCAAMLLSVLFVLSLLMSPTLSADRSIAADVGIRGMAVGVSVLGAFIGAKEKKKKKTRR